MRTNLNIKTIFVILFFFIISNFLLADIWKHHVNSNEVLRLSCSQDEIWVMTDEGGLVRWDINTGEYERYYDGTGFYTTSINSFTYNDENRLFNPVKKSEIFFKVCFKYGYIPAINKDIYAF